MLNWIAAAWVGLIILISVRVVRGLRDAREEMKCGEEKLFFHYFLIKKKYRGKEKFSFPLVPVSACFFYIQLKIDADDDNRKDMVSKRRVREKDRISFSVALNFSSENQTKQK